MLYRKQVTGNNIEKNKKAFDTLKVNEDLFCEEELETALKELKNN